MPLTKYERKERLGYGKQKEIADELAKEFGDGYDEALVSLVINDKAQARDPEKVKRVRAAIARRLRMPIGEVFPEPGKLAVSA
jgi:hypothetical protein